MDKSTLSPEVKQRIQAMCKQISVAHDLDPEIQKELFGHMEDKLLAYLSGDETVTEADALILVREHFGNPTTLKSMLQEVHSCEYQISLFRRIAGGIFAWLLLAFFYKICQSAILLTLSLWIAASGHNATADFLLPQCLFLMVRSATLLAFWLIVRHWQHGLDHGHPAWFFTTQPRFLIYLCLGMLIIFQLFPYVAFGNLFKPIAPPAYALYVVWIGVGCGVIITVLNFFLFLWWCDQPPRTPKTMLWGLCSLLSLDIIRDLPFLRTVLILSSTQPEAGMDMLQGKVPGMACYWNLSFGSAIFQWWIAAVSDPKSLPHIGAVLRALFPMPIMTYGYLAGCGVMAVMIHTGINIYRKRQMLNEQ
jgi:hypothetical protein